jgi:hypothetical protein
VRAQAIEFESGGLLYQTLTKAGLTIMFAPLPDPVAHYSVLQMAVSNGSPVSRTVRTEDFQFIRADGSKALVVPPHDVVLGFLRKANYNDVVRLVDGYEQGLYGLKNFRSTGGYESRRQASMTAFTSSRLKAAAAASAVVFVTSKLNPGQSTDGALFFDTQGKPLGAGKLTVTASGERFEFDVSAAPHTGGLKVRP